MKFCANNEQSMRPQVAICEAGLNGYEGCHLLGITDGVGREGAHISMFVSRLLVACLKEGLKDLDSREYKREELVDVIVGSFEVTNSKLIASGLDCKNSGCTCLLALIYDDYIITANLGDVRAVIGADRLEQFQVESLSTDHTNLNLEEKNRIKVFADSQPTSVFASEHHSLLEKGALPLTRAFGCSEAWKLGLFWYPEVKTFKLRKYDRYLLLGTQGLFKLASNKQLLAFCHDEMRKGASAQKAAEKLRGELQNKRRAQTAAGQLTFLLVELSSHQ